MTSRFKNSYYWTYKTQPTFDVTHEGEVLPLDNLDRPGTWNIATGDPRFPVANVAPHNVVGLVVLKGEAVKKVQEAPRAHTWTVQGSKGNIYTITEITPGGALRCNCIAGQYNRPCKHKAEIEKKRR